ncbi:protocadherin gamma-C5-like isoform X7 [Pygocentrus nattereri]|uniref:protocadherin gamma-C5-like isoform X7 n=1 Tax=Pygocentrus nattereri TaxID=42514 RepID=UPI0018915160|nr:protocadherin gamma-C5-like isoform X7 [Pygocentrus nattereri]
MDNAMRDCLSCALVLPLICASLWWATVNGQIRYTVAEESKKGSVVGNLAKDLGLSLADMSSRKVRIASEASERFFGVDLGRGELVVEERIDREAVCGQSGSCALPLEVIADSPWQLHRVVAEIQDINDNAPSFPTKEMVLKVAEHAVTGTRFPLESAQDPDVGSNAVRSYTLNSNEYFSVATKTLKNGRKLPELVLAKLLDREKQSTHELLLTAVDGGSPVKSGTAKITVHVLDNNDNAPQFSKQTYESAINEKSPPGTVIVELKAVDLDEGSNGQIRYLFGERAGDDIFNIFDLNSETGLLTLKGSLDYEEVSSYEIDVVAKDGGSPEMEGHCTVQINLVDANDNRPDIIIKSLADKVLEDSPIGTVVGLINARDLDANENGKIDLQVISNTPFKLKPSFENHYELATTARLDREKNVNYNVEISATDSGNPPLSTKKTVTINVQDVNDNPPVFSQPSYTVYVKENFPAGRIICSVSASDADLGENAKISYSILASKVQDVSVSSYVYINSDNGSIYSMYSFDYENLKVFQIQVQAKDHGSPSLSSKATVYVFILDQNDNVPAVIYPSVASNYKMPRSTKAGHLLTKVTAVDADSGHNAWISYKLLEATDASLFSVNTYTGEVRTKHAVSEHDDSPQRILIEIKDNGDPVQSSTVTLNVVLEDSLHDPVLDLQHKAPEPISRNGRITFYLIVSLASVSLLSLVTFVILVVKCARNSRGSCLRRTNSDSYKNPTRNLQIQLNTDGPIKYVEVLGGDMLSQSQSFRSCLSPMSEFSDFTLIKPSSTFDFKDMISVLDASLPDSTWTFESQQQKPPNTDWRFTQNQRPGPSGAAATPEVAVGTGPWPNPPTEAEQLQALMAAANEVSEATNTLGPGTMGLSTRYSPQFTLQHVPDYRQNVYIPGSTATLTANPQQPQQALPPPQASGAQPEPPKAAQTPASKKKSTKKEKK